MDTAKTGGATAGSPGGTAGSGVTGVEGQANAPVERAPMTPDQVSSLMAKASASMGAARKDLQTVATAVGELARTVTGDITKLDRALEGNMIAVEGQVRDFADMAIEAGRQAQAYHAVLEKKPA